MAKRSERHLCCPAAIPKQRCFPIDDELWLCWKLPIDCYSVAMVDLARHSLPNAKRRDQPKAIVMMMVVVVVFDEGNPVDREIGNHSRQRHARIVCHKRIQ